ncbi:FAD-binding oxidoreductase [Aliishimia ponticola]|uniref:FAD-binding oxidoreductase n=1 Tax=Aliishimia ponticola TaxID=2499833 RepID=A0A4S4NJL1_9RHOB|nr:FAD-binding oxidoreductase [Aliishimia ponticola]THH38947.1 FAD-binding oxidoreductase [Aliishimia ponticola]
MKPFPISESTPVTYPGPLPEAADVVVIGGGVMGVSTALHLARAGQKVVLCEKGRIAGEQSSRNWGWIRQQGRDLDELPIMIESAAIWRELERETNQDFGLRQVGVTYLAETQAEADRYAEWLRKAAPLGASGQMLSREETAARAPQMSRSYVGAIHTAADMKAEPFLAVPAIAGIAARDGAVLVENCAVRVLETTGGAVSGVVTEQGRIACSRVVVAGGAWSALFLRAHGVDIPQLSVRASVCRTQALPDIGVSASADNTVAWRRRSDGGYTLAPGGFHELFVGPDAFRAFRKYIKQMRADGMNTTLLPSAPQHYPDHWFTPRKWAADEVSPFERLRVLNPAPNMKALRRVAQGFGTLFPELGPIQIEQAWAGLIDTMPDVVPVVDEAPQISGLFIGTGLSGHGFGIGPGMGRVMASLVRGQAPGHDLTRFRLSRFTDGSEIDLGPAL